MAFNYRTEYHRYRQYYLNLRQYYQRPKAKVSFFVLLSFFTVVFFSVFAIRPTVTTIGLLVREIEDKRNIDKSLEEKLQALDNLQGQMVAIQSELPLILSLVPESSDLGRLMQEFELIAGQQTVVLLSVEFQPVKLTETQITARDEARMINFSLTVGGSFDTLTNFLNSLETLDRMVALQKTTFLSGAANLRQVGVQTVVEVEGQAFFISSLPFEVTQNEPS